jgi:hypothetical protein
LELPESDMHPTAQDLQRRKLRDWLLALLRFSLTLEPGEAGIFILSADEHRHLQCRF